MRENPDFSNEKSGNQESMIQVYTGNGKGKTTAAMVWQSGHSATERKFA